MNNVIFSGFLLLRLGVISIELKKYGKRLKCVTVVSFTIIKVLPKHLKEKEREIYKCLIDLQSWLLELLMKCEWYLDIRSPYALVLTWDIIIKFFH